MNKLSKSDIAILVLQFLKDSKFEETCESFQKEAQSLLDGPKKTMPWKLSGLCADYHTLKEESQRKEEFIKSAGPAGATQYVNNILVQMFSVLDVFNKAVNPNPVVDRIPLPKSPSKSEDRKPLRQIPVVQLKDVKP